MHLVGDPTSKKTDAIESYEKSGVNFSCKVGSTFRVFRTLCDVLCAAVRIGSAKALASKKRGVPSDW